MKIAYNWLRDFVAIDWEASKTGELLTDLGLEVEGIDQFESVKGGLKGVVVGKVMTCIPHPNADKLKVTTVDLGEDSPVQIVCGAPNVAAGQHVPVATVGTKLYTKEGEPFKIKKSKIRGEESYGMICAEDELGLGENHDGIMVLPEETIPGTPLATILNIATDEVFEIGLTPNRADAMSHMGTARDLKAGLIQKGIKASINTPSVSNFQIENRSTKIDVQVQEKNLAPRYAGVAITNIEIKESPNWLKNRLKSIGLAPINNVVDATNYVLHELGQPLHAFDLAQIKGNKVIVRKANAGEKFITLDGIERELDPEDLMICNESSPMCIAGVFGGLKSGVSERTTGIFLESAYFNPVSIRKTAKRHGLNTDASFRFERGVDPNMTVYALKRAALLIQELSGGIITSELEDLYSNKFEDYQVFLSFQNVDTLIGEKIDRETIKKILASLEIKITNVTESGVGLLIPFYRVDVQREADVIEEILRVYGYNNIGNKEKLNASITFSEKINPTKIQNTISDHLVSIGFHEAMNNSLTSPEYVNLVEELDANENVTMLNPLSQDLATMRQSLLFGGLESIAYNINRRNQDLKLFEIGKTYHSKESFTEISRLALFITGNKKAENWIEQPIKTDFFYIKGVVKSILSKLGIENFQEKPSENSIFSEGLAIYAGKIKLGEFGIVSVKLTKTFGIKTKVFYADLLLDTVYMLAKTKKITLKTLPKYPEVRRDFALLLDRKVQFKDLYTKGFKTEKKILKDINLFDVYEGEKLPDGKKSYALSFALQDENKTLNDKQIDKIMSKLQKIYEDEFGASLR